MLNKLKNIPIKENATSPKYSVLIVGAGNIGALFDNPNTSNILTHAHAFYAHKSFNLIGFVDTDQEKARYAAQLWNTMIFESIQSAFAQQKIHIVCVAVPDKFHYNVLKELSKYQPQLIFAEKPITKKLYEAREIIKIYKSKKIPILVNYSRRFVPEFETIKQNISKNLYGKYVTGTGYYGKGFLHNGSHLIDLLRFLIGEIKKIDITNKSFDYTRDDQSISGVLTFLNNKNFFIQHIDCRLYTIFEIDLLFEKKRIRITNSGATIEEHDIKENKIFDGYKNIIKTKKYNTSLNMAILYAAKNIYNHLNKNEPLKCSGDNAYAAMKICLEG